MDLLTYVESHRNCAINYVPQELFLLWREMYPQLDLPYPMKGRSSVRFLNGTHISYSSSPYHVGETYIGGNVEAVIDGLMISNCIECEDDKQISLVDII